MTGSGLGYSPPFRSGHGAPTRSGRSPTTATTCSTLQSTPPSPLERGNTELERHLPGIEERTERVHTPMANTKLAHPSASGSEITVYWRPGCPFCSSLRGGLHRAGLPFREVNIWDDPNAAAFVRSVARGNETVPTVSIGKVNLVNPSARRVLEVAATETPALLSSPLLAPHRRRWFGRHTTAGN